MAFQIHVIDGPPSKADAESALDPSAFVKREEFLTTQEAANTEKIKLTNQVTRAEKAIHEIQEYLHHEKLKRDALRQLRERLAPTGPSRSKVQRLSQGS